MFEYSVLRAALVSALVCGVAAVLMIEFGPTNRIGLMRVKVVNDTNRAVKIQPCWDRDCHDTRGLPEKVMGPGKRGMVSGQWADDQVQTISVGVLEPKDSVPHFDGCLVQTYAPHQKVAVFYVSWETSCPQGDEGGGGGF